MTQPPASSHPPAELLGRTDWVRRLAWRLVRDPALAEDLTQEAWVAALERPAAVARLAGDVHAWRAWLGGALRNLAREERRARGRRGAREQAAARPEAEPAADEALARVARQRDVAEAVLALEEPYRTTVVLRWFEDLPPRRIAARQGVPVATVKSRLARAHALLRRRLDQEYGGDGRAWALALLPLAATRRGSWLLPSVATPWIGALAVNTPTKIALVALPLAGVALWVRHTWSTPIAPPSEALARAAEPAVLATPEEEAEVLAPSAPEPQRADVAPAPPDEPTPELVVTGRVVDLEERPVAGVPLHHRYSSGTELDVVEGRIRGSFAIWREDLPEGTPLAVSDADGRFRFSPENRFGVVVAIGEEFETVYAASWHDGPENLIVVVAPRRSLEGRVVDAEGVSVVGASLRLIVPEDLSRAIGASLAQGLLSVWKTTSGADGFFAFERLPVIEGAPLYITAEGFASQQLVPPEPGSDWLEVVLERAGQDGARVEGVVLGPAGPVAGARVAVQAGEEAYGTRPVRSVMTDAAGRFTLGLAGLERATALSAYAAGFAPVLHVAEVDADGRALWPELVTLTLAAPTRELRGVVRTVDSAPAAGHMLWLLGGQGVQEEGQVFATLLEASLAGKPEVTHKVESDASGRFVFSGLQERSYSLRVEDPATGLLFDAGPFEATLPGDPTAHELEIVLPADALWPALRGHVRAPDGTPIANAGVAIEGEAYLAQGVDGFAFLYQSHGPRTTTAEDGSFALGSVPRAGAKLIVRGSAIVQLELRLEELADLPRDALEIVVFRKAQLRVLSTATAPEATGYSVLDEAGETVLAEIPQGGGSSHVWLVPLAGGRAPVVTVGENGVSLVLYKGEEELRRLPLQLVPGELTALDL